MATHHPYSDNADAIEAILRYVCRKNRLSADDGDEFSSFARLKLLEDDCAILRKFGGLSTLKTFLNTVVINLFHDWRISRWGKWRPTAEARRLGPVAIELERLCLRDRIEYEQSAQLLISKAVAESMQECDTIWAQLKRRTGRSFVEVDQDLPSATPSYDPILDDERKQLVARVTKSLRDALAQLPPGDALIFQLRYWDKVSVANIARTQGVEQKPLYRRFDELFRRIKEAMLSSGVTEGEIRGLFDDLGIDAEDSAKAGREFTIAVRPFHRTPGEEHE